jgi:lycopene cyclase domain-containing protein
MKWLYLLVMLFTLSYPLYKSFEDKVHYYGKWRFLLKAVVPVALFFIIWDNWFTQLGVWHFNSDYVLDLFIGYLPLEEYLFFFFVPFSCVFIHEVLYYFVPKDVLGKYAKIISWVLIVLSTILMYTYQDKLYPLVLFGLLILFLLLQLFVIQGKYIGRFYLTYLVSTIPFLLVNGILTAMPIVVYNPKAIIGVRIYSIPVEDWFYGLLMLFMVISLYEYFKKRAASRTS